MGLVLKYSPVASRPVFCRLISSITDKFSEGTTAILVPVKPVCRSSRRGVLHKCVGIVHHPAKPILKLSFVRNRSTVFSLINCRLPALPLASSISTSFEDRQPWQTTLPPHLRRHWHTAGIAIVHFSTQGIRAPAVPLRWINIAENKA